jgi:phage repressor protein C with HTH and peptisase S24 domain
LSTFSSQLNTGILRIMDIYEIRKLNLIKLIGKQKKASCAERWGMSPAHLSQILSNKTAKNLGDDVARRIEEVEGLPWAWFDSIPFSEAAPVTDLDGFEPASDDEKSSSTSSTAELMSQMLSSKAGKNLSEKVREMVLAAAAQAESSLGTNQSYVPSNYSSLKPKNDEILIPQYDIRAAMGDGQLPPDYTEVVRNLVVREELLREKGVTYTAAASLAMINGWGQSMEGTINDKDLVIVDKGVRDFIGEGIYVLTWHNELYIKRMMRLDEDNYRLISDNPHYENQTARIDDVTIHAKVLLIWNARKA